VPNLPPTHRILLVDAASFAYFPIAALRGAVVPGWENKITAPLTTASVFGDNSPHKVIAPNKVVELRIDSIILEKEFEGQTEIPFFVRLFIADKPEVQYADALEMRFGIRHEPGISYARRPERHD
jgi:hypothetical protein